MKQIILTAVTVLVIGVLLGMVVIGSRDKKNKTPNSGSVVERNLSITPSSSNEVPILFYSETCSHCKEVEEWLKENKIEERVKITKKEVHNNKTNSLELVKAAESCGLPTNSIGVPFLYTPEGKCLVGPSEITSYLSNKAGLSVANEATLSGEGNK